MPIWSSGHLVIPSCLFVRPSYEAVSVAPTRQQLRCITQDVGPFVILPLFERPKRGGHVMGLHSTIACDF
ncbi:unnamed protein product [Protopolystoma xenopodis]|uniref:Uncharacterized protein n=1 Tax=Protopolystoma xenopodis TaxID=117903 RepID=A0A3S5C980_9PLAT|nr:unnamed protein product [Protopolystoma xenopodis]